MNSLLTIRKELDNESWTQMAERTYPDLVFTSSRFKELENELLNPQAEKNRQLLDKNRTLYEFITQVKIPRETMEMPEYKTVGLEKYSLDNLSLQLLQLRENTTEATVIAEWNGLTKAIRENVIKQNDSVAEKTKKERKLQPYRERIDAIVQEYNLVDQFFNYGIDFAVSSVFRAGFDRRLQNFVTQNKLDENDDVLQVYYQFIVDNVLPNYDEINERDNQKTQAVLDGDLEQEIATAKAADDLDQDDDESDFEEDEETQTGPASSSRRSADQNNDLDDEEDEFDEATGLTRSAVDKYINPQKWNASKWASLRLTDDASQLLENGFVVVSMLDKLNATLPELRTSIIDQLETYKANIKRTPNREPGMPTSISTWMGVPTPLAFHGKTVRTIRIAMFERMVDVLGNASRYLFQKNDTVSTYPVIGALVNHTGVGGGSVTLGRGMKNTASDITFEAYVNLGQVQEPFVHVPGSHTTRRLDTLEDDEKEKIVSVAQNRANNAFVPPGSMVVYFSSLMHSTYMESARPTEERMRLYAGMQLSTIKSKKPPQKDIGTLTRRGSVPEHVVGPTYEFYPDFVTEEQIQQMASVVKAAALYDDPESVRGAVLAQDLYTTIEKQKRIYAENNEGPGGYEDVNLDFTEVGILPYAVVYEPEELDSHQKGEIDLRPDEPKAMTIESRIRIIP